MWPYFFVQFIPNMFCHINIRWLGRLWRVLGHSYNRQLFAVQEFYASDRCRCDTWNHLKSPFSQNLLTLWFFFILLKWHYLSILLSINIKFPTPKADKQPHTISDPPPNLIVGRRFLMFIAVFGFLHIIVVKNKLWRINENYFEEASRNMYDFKWQSHILECTIEINVFIRHLDY